MFSVYYRWGRQCVQTEMRTQHSLAVSSTVSRGPPAHNFQLRTDKIKFYHTKKNGDGGYIGPKLINAWRCHEIKWSQYDIITKSPVPFSHLIRASQALPLGTPHTEAATHSHEQLTATRSQSPTQGPKVPHRVPSSRKSEEPLPLGPGSAQLSTQRKEREKR